MYKDKKYQYLINSSPISLPNSLIYWNTNKVKDILFQRHDIEFFHEYTLIVKKEIGNGHVISLSESSFSKFKRNNHGFFDV
tara:strand:+ start:439 stop:681 length:243 start_codon:yes stop_codon:yes gene_type:complete